MTLRRSIRAPFLLLALAAMIWLAALLEAGTAAAATQPMVRLAHKPTGLVVTAPRGYAITQANGFYTVRGGGTFAVFGRGVSPLEIPAAAKQLVTASKGKLLGRATSTPTSWLGTMQVGRRAWVLQLRRAPGSQLDVSLMGIGAPPAAARAGRRIVLGPRQVAQIQALNRIIQSRRGGAVAVLNVPLPMRLAQTDDNGARANVPDLPGWTVTGGNGLFAVEHPTLGFGWFGMTIAAATPAMPFATAATVVAAPSADPGAMLVSVLPQYLTKTFGQQFAFVDVRLVPGTEGILGPTIPSAMYSVRFTYKGLPMTGLFKFGMTNFSDWFTNTYFSGIGIADAAPGGVAPALLESWATASGEVGFRERLAVTTELAAKGEGAILSPSRFRAGASTWIDLVQSGRL